MKSKRHLFLAAVLTATAIVSGCSGEIQSSVELPKGRTEFAGEVNLDLVSDDDETFDPIIADERAIAHSQDVLIPASKARIAPALSDGRWINSAATTLGNLRGRVVLVDFWTFGCYNCRNTLPALNRFDAKYRDKGLTIVGVHTPESAYEGKFENVLGAVGRYGIKYPVVTDVDGETWRAYSIEAWPTVIILDKQGRIRYTHLGEGRYDVQERVIRTLLSEN